MYSGICQVLLRNIFLQFLFSRYDYVYGYFYLIHIIALNAPEHYVIILLYSIGGGLYG